jgi:hypothetical protein
MKLRLKRGTFSEQPHGRCRRASRTAPLKVVPSRSSTSEALCLNAVKVMDRMSASDQLM